MSGMSQENLTMEINKPICYKNVIITFDSFYYMNLEKNVHISFQLTSLLDRKHEINMIAYEFRKFKRNLLWRIASY